MQIGISLAAAYRVWMRAALAVWALADVWSYKGEAALNGQIVVWETSI